MIYSWRIINIVTFDSDDFNDIVESFEWQITAEQNGYNASYSGYYTTRHEVNDRSGFFELSDLTKDIFISWVEQALGEELNQIKIHLSKQVNKEIENSSKKIISEI